MITTNDIEKAKQQCYYIYQEFQATMAGQTMSDTDALENHFSEVCSEFGLNIEDTWEWCENQHESLIAV